MVTLGYLFQSDSYFNFDNNQCQLNMLRLVDADKSHLRSR